jgi:Fe-S-cluster containining protein
MKSESWNSLCDSCKTKPCCTGYTSPLVFPHEYDEIKKSLSRAIEFVNPITINNTSLYELRKKNNSNECIFWKSTSCSIYENRPFDCRLFPFDIYKINGKYTWIVYSCNPNSDWSWSESFLHALESDPSFSNSIKYLNAFSDLRRLEHDNNTKAYEFQVLREVNLNKRIETMKAKDT